MEKCKNCNQYRKYLNEDGICILCLRGPGGNATEKKVDSDKTYATGKPLKSAVIEK